jgi:hypothetical protein
MNTPDFNFDAALRRGGLTRHFSLRGDLHDVADAMLKLRVLAAYEPCRNLLEIAGNAAGSSGHTPVG